MKNFGQIITSITSISSIYLFSMALWLIVGVAFFLYTANVIAETDSSKTVVCANTCRSPDGKYEAVLAGIQYEIKEIKTGKVVLTTHDKFLGSNDVKGGAFVFWPKSKTFRAVYHYGHKGPCTWIGTWDLKTGNLIGGEEKSGFIRDATSVLGKEGTCT